MSSIQSSARSATKQEAFHKVFGLPSVDPYGHIICTFDVLKKGEGSFLHPYDFLYNTITPRA
jgi:hypothetical protein